MDDGKVKLVPASESANDDKKIETIYQPPDSLLHVISSKEKSSLMRIPALRSHELDSDKKENSSESHMEEADVEKDIEEHREDDDGLALSERDQEQVLNGGGGDSRERSGSRRGRRRVASLRVEEKGRARQNQGQVGATAQCRPFLYFLTF